MILPLASHLASLRKVNETNQPKPPISTPAEFSRMKYERELKMQERQEQYRQQMIAQQRVSASPFSPIPSRVVPRHSGLTVSRPLLPRVPVSCPTSSRR